MSMWTLVQDSGLASPLPGPSELQQQHLERQMADRVQDSLGMVTGVQESKGIAGGVQDSLLSCQPRKVEQEGRGLRQANSRISSASFSSFSLNYLQSPRLKSSDAVVGQVSMEYWCRNFVLVC